MEIAALKNLTFSYSGSETPALEGIDLSISRGELVLLCGPSGSGKSTLLRQLKPAIMPKGVSSGEAFFNGRPVSELSSREQAEKIAYVGQSPENMIVTDKVWHELAFSLESLGCESRLIRRRTAEMAEFFGLTDKLRDETAKLSGGQKQLLALASAMTTRPELLILDEPSSQLDPIASKELFEAVLRINRELGTTVIICEHRLEEAFAICDRLVMMSRGRINIDSPVSQLDIKKLDPSAAMLLPVPARVWRSLGSECECPHNVSQGRLMLSDALQAIEPDPVPIRQSETHSPYSIEIKGLSFRYEKNTPDVLSSLDLKVGQGEFIGILGGNGCGKSTLMSVMAGFKKPYSGSMELKGKRLLLPQQPASLFCHDKLIDDLKEIRTSDAALSEMISLCRLEGLTDRHPFDLSGGELQRAALAKLLLASPDILLLDEPTKGTDPLFKYELAQIIRSLTVKGITVIAVTHDVEFAASYCGRCAMLFSGELLGLAAPQEFFGSNLFYTTAASRMSWGLIENAVTAEDILLALGKRTETPLIPPHDDKPRTMGSSDIPKVDKPRSSPLKIAAKAVSTGLLLFSSLGCMELFPSLFGKRKIIPYILLAVSVCLTAVSFSDGRRVTHSAAKKRPPSARSVISAGMIAVLIPLTVFAGSQFINTGRYLFVSLLVILEASLPFYLLFEGRRPGARELVTVAVMTGAAIAGRIAFYMLPQFKPVMAIVIITGAAFGSQTGFLVGSLSMLISNFMFGQGPWTPWQMFSMGLIGVLSGIIFGRGVLPMKRELIALFGFFSAVFVYGAIVNPSTLFIMHNEINAASLSAAYAAGLPLDIIHGAATLGFLYALAPSLLKKLERLRTKYGFFE